MADKILGEFPKKNVEVIVAKKNTFKEKVYFDLRIWYGNSNLKPTKKGLTILFENLPKFKKFINELEVK